jgi:hypothetical protein
MKRSILVALAVLTVGSLDRAAADPAEALFGCDARRTETCYFKIYYTPRRTRIVQLLAGMKEDIPDVEIGSTRYCVEVGKPPAYKCTQKTVNAGYNN